jgi:PUA domain protein
MRSKDARKLLQSLSGDFGELEAKKVEVAEFEENKVYIFDDVIEFIENENRLYPYLGGSYLDVLPRVVVDMGAIRFVCNGADVMAPGITDVDEFEKDSIVVIRDMNHGKALAIGMARKSSAEIIRDKKGKVIKNLHYVGDKLWENASA